jgi:hypothetical protein
VDGDPFVEWEETKRSQFKTVAEQCPPEWTCVKCGKGSDGDKGPVKKIALNQPGAAAQPLHTGCAEEWFINDID